MYAYIFTEIQNMQGILPSVYVITDVLFKPNSIENSGSRF
jgi:hypothetical protein